MAQPEVRTNPSEKRVKTFSEVSLGYTKKLTTDESRRCPQCADTVCVNACPLGINVLSFIRMLREGQVDRAYEIIKERNPLPSITGRICSAPCEVACILNEENAPIGIRALERYAADHQKVKSTQKETVVRKGYKVAIIGSGPTGLAAASQLAKKGYQVTIFESLDKPGGVLRYGIPEFRIPKKILNAEIEGIKALGVDIKTNMFIGQTVTLDELKEDKFGAILLAMGAGVPKFMDLPGTNLGGVYYGEEFLMRINLMEQNIFAKQTPNFALGQKVAVIGSGNTALDCARAAVRLDRDVTLLFRRTEDEMRVRSDERRFAKEEGVQFESLVRPIEVMSDQNNFVSGLKCVHMDFADEDGKGNWELKPVPGSDFKLDADTVVIAIGHKPNSIIHKIAPDLKLNKDGTIAIDEKTGQTSMKGIFASGNVVTNAGPVVEAIAGGVKAAEKIDQYLK